MNSPRRRLLLNRMILALAIVAILAGLLLGQWGIVLRNAVLL